MKCIEIYKTNKDFKILTLYKLEAGSYMTSEPIFIMPGDVKLEDLGDKIYEALNASRNLLESEEDKFWLGSKLLKKIKESSFDKFYEASVSCSVSFSDGIVSIAPQKYLGKNQGLEILEDRAYRVTLDKNNRLEVIQKLMQMLTTL
jgi:hypothetical protein